MAHTASPSLKFPARRADAVTFVANGDLTLFSTGTPFDGTRDMRSRRVVSQAALTQRVDATGSGAGGTTRVRLFKRDTAGTRTEITLGTNLEVAQGSGDNARDTSVPSDVSEATLSPGDRLEVEFDSIQTAGATTAPEDASVTVKFR